MKPRNDSSSLRVVGAGQVKMDSSFEGAIEIPEVEIT